MIKLILLWSRGRSIEQIAKRIMQDSEGLVKEKKHMHSGFKLVYLFCKQHPIIIITSRYF